MKAVITILTTAIAMTALAVPHHNARDIKSAEGNTTTLVPTPTTKLLPPTESAEMVDTHSSDKVVATVTPSPSASSQPASASNSTAEDNKDGKKKVHVIGSLMNSLGLDGVMGSLSSLMTAQ